MHSFSQIQITLAISPSTNLPENPSVKHFFFSVQANLVVYIYCSIKVFQFQFQDFR